MFKKMKSHTCLLSLLLAVFSSCQEENGIEDPVYEFVAFQEETIQLDERQNSTSPYPVVAELFAFEPYHSDIQLNLEITGTNAEKGEDYTVQPGTTLTIQAGSLISDTLYLTTIDNSAFSGDRSLTISIKSTSKPGIRVGLGISEPARATVRAEIRDDECSSTTKVFDMPDISNKITYEGGENITAVAGSLSGNSLTFTGDLIDYSTFSGAQLTVFLTPSAEGATAGSVSFGEQETGTDKDGYKYKFVQVGEGTYDVCRGAIEITYEIYYLDGEAWIYWYTVKNILSV